MTICRYVMQAFATNNVMDRDVLCKDLSTYLMFICDSNFLTFFFVS